MWGGRRRERVCLFLGSGRERERARVRVRVGGGDVSGACRGARTLFLRAPCSLRAPIRALPLFVRRSALLFPLQRAAAARRARSYEPATMRAFLTSFSVKISWIRIHIERSLSHEGGRIGKLGREECARALVVTSAAAAARKKRAKQRDPPKRSPCHAAHLHFAHIHLTMHRQCTLLLSLLAFCHPPNLRL